MGEVVGLVASIVQRAGTGAQLSSALYHFTTSAARADQGIADIASDIELTSNALESVRKVFKAEDTKSIVSDKAIADANSLIKQCEGVFKDISELIEMRRTVSKQEGKNLSVVGKLSWPMKEQRVELYKRRLESLKNSLTLLLNVLQLAQAQERGQSGMKKVEQERAKIRELHQQQQDSLECLKALEARLSTTVIDAEAPSEESKVSLHATTPQHLYVSLAQAPDSDCGTDNLNGNLRDASQATTKNDNTSQINVSDSDDERDMLSQEELAKAEQHVRKLLRRITQLQKSSAFPNDRSLCKKSRMDRIYQQFCRKWETDLALAPRCQESDGTESIDAVTTSHRQQHAMRPNLERSQRHLWSREAYYSNFMQNMYPTAMRSTSEPAVSDDDGVNQQLALLLMQPYKRLSPDANNTTYHIELPEDTQQQQRAAFSQEHVGTPPQSLSSSERDRADYRSDGLSEHQAWGRWQDRGRTTDQPAGSGNKQPRALSREERRREIELGCSAIRFDLLMPNEAANLEGPSSDKALRISSGSKVENRNRSTSPQTRPRFSSVESKRERSCSMPSSKDDQLDTKIMGQDRLLGSSAVLISGEPRVDIVDILLQQWTIQVD